MACFDRFRYVIAVLVMGSTLTAYLGRINLGVALPSIVRRPSDLESPDANTSASVCPAPTTPLSMNSTDQTSNHTTTVDKFDWSDTDQGLLITSFFYIYVVMQIPGGVLSERFGPRLLTSVALLVTGVGTALMPLLASHSLGLLIASRVLMGFVQGMVMPGTYCLVSRWIPPSERSTALGMVIMGTSLGAIIASFLTGYLCKHVSWEMAFYIPGGAITAFGLLYAALITDHPRDHFLVSATELTTITKHTRNRLDHSFSVDTDAEILTPQSSRQPKFPWAKLLRSKVIWATSFVKMANNAAFSFMYYSFPLYMQAVLRVDSDRTGYYMGGIFLVASVSYIVGGALADYCIGSGCNRTTTRKVIQSVATFAAAIGFAALPQTGCNVTAFLSASFAIIALLSLVSGGESSVPTDLTTRFAATLFSFTNTICMITSFTPYIYGSILERNSHHIQQTWFGFFYFIAAINVVGGVGFVVFVSAEPLDWDDDYEVVKHESKPEAKMTKSVSGKRRNRALTQTLSSGQPEAVSGQSTKL